MPETWRRIEASKLPCHLASIESRLREQGFQPECYETPVSFLLWVPETGWLRGVFKRRSAR